MKRFCSFISFLILAAFLTPLYADSVSSEKKSKSEEIEIDGMVEVTSLKRGAPQQVSIWTTFDIPQEDGGKKLLPYLHRMVKVKGQLVKQKGNWVFKVSKVAPVAEEPRAE